MWGSRHDILGPFLPHPDDISVAPRRPHQRFVGDYVFKRDMLGDTVEIYEPGGASYELVWFDWTRYLKLILKIREQDQVTIEDRLWNFRDIKVTIPESLTDIVRVDRNS